MLLSSIYEKNISIKNKKYKKNIYIYKNKYLNLFYIFMRFPCFEMISVRFRDFIIFFVTILWDTSLFSQVYS